MRAISVNHRRYWALRRFAPTKLYVTNEKKLAPSSILIAISALRFLYKVTLHKDWSLEEIIPAPKKPQTLPIVLSPEEVLQFLSCVQSIKHRTILTTCYAAGLRVSEATQLIARNDAQFGVLGTMERRVRLSHWLSRGNADSAL